MPRVRITREGYPFIFAAIILALLAFVLGWRWAGLLFAFSALGFAFFFRDPERIPPAGEDSIVSPADGKVVRIRPVEKEALFEGETQISIFLSPLDVHVNRAPVRGRVEEVRYRKGSFLAAYRDEASWSNEHNALKVVDPEGRRLGVVQIAGVLARRIVCYVRPGDSLEKGQRFGLIMFGSRVDLFLPSGTRVEVSEGQRVKGGETIIGRLS